MNLSNLTIATLLGKGRQILKLRQSDAKIYTLRHKIFSIYSEKKKRKLPINKYSLSALK